MQYTLENNYKKGVIKTYYLRRIFERLGFDDNFMRLFSKAYCKIVKKYGK